MSLQNSSKKKARENNVTSGHVTDVTSDHVTSEHVTSSNVISGDVTSGSAPFPNKLWLQKQQISVAYFCSCTGN